MEKEECSGPVHGVQEFAFASLTIVSRKREARAGVGGEWETVRRGLDGVEAEEAEESSRRGRATASLEGGGFDPSSTRHAAASAFPTNASRRAKWVWLARSSGAMSMFSRTGGPGPLSSGGRAGNAGRGVSTSSSGRGFGPAIAHGPSCHSPASVDDAAYSGPDVVPR